MYVRVCVCSTVYLCIMSLVIHVLSNLLKVSPDVLIIYVTVHFCYWHIVIWLVLRMLTYAYCIYSYVCIMLYIIVYVCTYVRMWCAN